MISLRGRDSPVGVSPFLREARAGGNPAKKGGTRRAMAERPPERPVLQVSNNKGNQSVMLSSPAAKLCSPRLMRSACRRRGTDRPLR